MIRTQNARYWSASQSGTGQALAVHGAGRSTDLSIGDALGLEDNAEPAPPNLCPIRRSNHFSSGRPVTRSNARQTLACLASMRAQVGGVAP